MREAQVQSLGQEDPLEKENGNPLQYSCLENPMEGGAWQATVLGVTKSRTQFSNETITHHHQQLGLGHCQGLASIPGWGAKILQACRRRNRSVNLKKGKGKRNLVKELRSYKLHGTVINQ